MPTRSGDYNHMHRRWLQHNGNSSGGSKGGRVSYGGYQGRDFNGRGRFYNGRSRTLRWKRQLEYGYSNNNNQYRNGGMNMNECPSPFVVRKGIPKSTAITGITFLLIIHCRGSDLWEERPCSLGILSQRQLCL